MGDSTVLDEGQAREEALSSSKCRKELMEKGNPGDGKWEKKEREKCGFFLQ